MRRSLFCLFSLMLVLLALPVQAQRAERPTRAGAVVRAGAGGTNAPYTTVVDGGFEASYDVGSNYINDDWRVSDSIFVSPICKVGGCGENTSFGAPRSGSHWVYFGATPSANTAFVQQKVVLPNTHALQLQYYVWASFSGAAATFTLSIDGTVVDSLPAGVTAGYVLRSVDLTAYADGAVHKLRFDYSKPAGGFADLNLDDVELYKGQAIYVDNPGFESPSSSWLVSYSTGDKIVCRTAAPMLSYHGNCAFRFKGGVGENSKLKQSFSLLRSVPAAASRAPLAYAAYLGAFVNAPPTVSGAMTLKLTLNDGSRLKAKATLSGNNSYEWMQTPFISYSSTKWITTVSIKVSHKSQSGKTFLDDVEIFQSGVY